MLALAVEPVNDVVAGSYGSFLIQTLLALVGVCLLAWLVLRFGVRRFVSDASATGPIKILARRTLEPRRTLYIIEAGDKTLLVGVGESGAMTTLAELSADAVDEALRHLPPRASFVDLLMRRGVKDSKPS